MAQEKAKLHLKPELYDAFNSIFRDKDSGDVFGWPTTVEDYLKYLDTFVKMTPNEINDPLHPKAWKSSPGENGYNRKVFDLLCQSYWMICQDVGDGQQKKTLQEYPIFSEWLQNFARDWGTFLDSEDSLTPESLRSFQNDRMYNYSLFSDNAKDWKTFNQFFARDFNHADPKTGISPLRPIVDPYSKTTIVSPAECTYKSTYRISNEGRVLSEETGSPTSLTLKHSHTIGYITELLQDGNLAQEFNGGTFIHYFLSPFDYHRFHSPVPGEVIRSEDFSGSVYLNVRIQDGNFDAPDSAEDGYEFKQARGLFVIDTKQEGGKVAVLPIGMAQVSSVHMNRELVGTEVVKGQEFGNFLFGGSDIIMLFQKEPSDMYIFTTDPAQNPIHFQYGQPSVLFQ
eukprot:CAMPEP_0114999770 /NCGR_PEP_ID=MMETSP0216-20121206/16346_1 /TAXON_ID=223996 /ORGANISM="Protocruzia adherens, Strain Boccale" /LENGTH=396 /DNA_ID=CAMNT_0002364713 /DNA_START=133 /DNA_END=1323 /DNA_ORIENTATION=+